MSRALDRHEESGLPAADRGGLPGLPAARAPDRLRQRGPAAAHRRRLARGRDSRYVSEMLAWLGIGDLLETKPPQLSMGQRQLVAVARAVVTPAGPAAGRRAHVQSRTGAGGAADAPALRSHKLGTAMVLATHSQDLLRRYPFPVLQMEGWPASWSRGLGAGGCRVRGRLPIGPRRATCRWPQRPPAAS